MTPKLDIAATKEADGSWRFDVQHSGSPFAGIYVGRWYAETSSLLFHSMRRAPEVHLTAGGIHFVSDAIQAIAAFFETHNALGAV